jgi:hypothetical protein
MHSKTSTTMAVAMGCALLGACTPGQTRARSDAAIARADVSVLRYDANADAPYTGTVDCADGARWIYLVDSNNALLRFEPDAVRLTPIGTLRCSATATPFSMAVDREANAYVLHSDHRIYQVSTIDAACSPTSYTPNQMGFELFGMGFVSNSAGSTDETLFIGGGPESGVGSGRSTLGSIGAGLGSVMRLGALQGSPELTGNGNAELWGFFPDSSPPSVREIDRNNGATLRSYDASGIGDGRPTAWAFAYWGGRYYIFIQTENDRSTNIFRVTEGTGAFEPVQMNIGYRIVGAGVSTCAPTDII